MKTSTTMWIIPNKDSPWIVSSVTIFDFLFLWKVQDDSVASWGVASLLPGSVKGEELLFHWDGGSGLLSTHSHHVATGVPVCSPPPPQTGGCCCSPPHQA